MDRNDIPDELDLIVLGAGNAGLAAASVVRDAGRSVLVIEERDVGGTCPLRGCVPKKVLVAVAEALDLIERAKDLSITVGPPAVDWSAVIDRKESVLAGTSASFERDLTERGIHLLHARARFTGERSVTAADRTFRARDVLVATGSTPRPLSLPGAEHLTSSDELLDLRAPPRSMIFVGAGVIAFELGHVFARLGTHVTLLEVAPRPLGPFDEEAVEHLVAATRAIGIELHTGVTLHAVEQDDTGLRVRFTHDGTEKSLTAERVAHGAGRIANTAGLDLEAAGVRTERGGIVTGSPYRSASNTAVWVAGDAVRDTPQLSPIATTEGRLAGRAILGEDVHLDYRSIPSCVFSVPTLATVGLTERAARDAGIAFTAKRNDMVGWKNGRSYAERHAWAKVLVGADDRILGAHILGHGAGEIIHPFGLAMKHGLRASDLRSFVWAYPTFTNDVKYLV
ncbi:MAG: NAD(P)/FAD-dependent oxidoreductase [Polyangiaceae bacterium]